MAGRMQGGGSGGAAIAVPVGAGMTQGVGPLRSGRRRATDGTLFRPAAGGAPGAGASASAARLAAAAAPGALLAIQEAAGAPSSPASAAAEERDRRARRRGGALIEALRDLQLALLDGAEGDVARLADLATLAEGEVVADPVLREAIAAIVLRARVELARRAAARLRHAAEKRA